MVNASTVILIEYRYRVIFNKHEYKHCHWIYAEKIVTLYVSDPVYQVKHCFRGPHVA